jgi:ABC-type molybdate transport system substrate-binding protein
MKPLILAGLTLAFAVTTERRSLAWESPAPDVVLYCTPALEFPLREAATQYRRESNVEVHIFVQSPDGQAGLIRHRARADVLVADAETIDVLKGEHLVRPESIAGLGDDPFVLIRKSGSNGAAETTAAQLVSTHATVLPDPTTAASFDGAAVLRKSLPATNFLRLIGVANTPTVIAVVRGDGQLLGVVNRTEAGSAGVTEAASLAAAATPISGALATNGQSRNAGDFLKFIAGPKGRAILKSAGLEVNS